MENISDSTEQRELSESNKKLLDQASLYVDRINLLMECEKNESVFNLLSGVGKLLRLACRSLELGATVSVDMSKLLDRTVNFCAEINETCIKDKIEQYLISNEVAKAKDLISSNPNMHLYFFEDKSTNPTLHASSIVLYYDRSTLEHVFMRSNNGKIERCIKISSPTSLSLEVITEKIEAKIKADECIKRLETI